MTNPVADSASDYNAKIIHEFRANEGHVGGPGADVMDEKHRGVRPWPADVSSVRAELLDDLVVVVAGAVRNGIRHGSPPAPQAYSSWPLIRACYIDQPDSAESPPAGR